MLLQLSRLVYASLSIIGIYVFYRMAKRYVRNYKSPLNDLRGPPSVSFWFGSFDLVSEADAYRLFERWTAEWGTTFKYYSIFQVKRLHTMDLRAITHILASDVYRKSNILVRFSPAFKVGHLGSGLLFVEGERHAQLRKIMNAAFSASQIRDFTSMFIEKSRELCEIWTSDLLTSPRKDGKLKVDVLKWMNRLALDTIGLAGFDYVFDSLHASEADNEPNELLRATRDLFTFNFLKLSFLIQLFFPATRIFRTEHSLTAGKAVDTVRRIGLRMIAQRKASILAARSHGMAGPFGKSDSHGRDLLTMLVRLSVDTNGVETGKMTDDEILSQIPSVLLAGHETTATSVTWTLFALATNPGVQSRLRDELLNYVKTSPTMEEINGLQYLDAVVREALRLHAPVGFTERVVTRADMIPLQEEIMDKSGVWIRSVRVAKGDKIFIPIRAVNRSKELWGMDAEEFRPDRWLDGSLTDSIRAIPGVYSNTLTFLYGSHACIGYRVALLQMKTMLFTLVRSFKFESAISPEDIGRRNNIVGRPYICSDPAAGTQLPLLISAVEPA